ncbi:sigma D regulator [Sodalis sp. (in: enterobacteria)]|uniref:sigma D regulator n=1 Tax=Sodalis sp. (in: enterobacteria) TaxID=1898979 RepID=UPI003F2AA1A3
MLNQLENLAKCVAGNNEFIDQWLQARKGLLVAYYHLIGLKPNKEKHTPLDEEALDAFCHQLVDYLSAGHFHVYDRIVPEGETTSALIYSALQENMQQIMALYDNHLESAIDHDNYLAFQEALSGVGEALANRFILEDKLIQQALEYSVQAASALPAANSADMARPA